MPSKRAGKTSWQKVGCARLDCHVVIHLVFGFDTELVAEAASASSTPSSQTRLPRCIPPAIRFAVQPECVSFRLNRQVLCGLDLANDGKFAHVSRPHKVHNS